MGATDSAVERLAEEDAQQASEMREEFTKRTTLQLVEHASALQLIHTERKVDREDSSA